MDYRLREQLRSARKYQRISLRALAKKIGSNYGHLSQVENGKIDPSVSLLERMLEPLGLELTFVRKDLAD
jgi:transcriptional regulator with XRE-family HTH domain